MEQPSIAPTESSFGTSSDWSKDGFALVHRAVVQRNNIRIEKLLSISPLSLEAKTTDRFKLTPLLVAAKYGCMDTFHFLLEMGAKPQAKSARGFNAVQCALVHNQYNLVSSLLDHQHFSVIEDIFHTVSTESLNISELANCLEVLNTIIFSHIVTAEREDGGEAARRYEEQIKSADGISTLIDLAAACFDQRKMLDYTAPTIARIVQNLYYSDALFEDILKSSMPETQMMLMEIMESPEGMIALIHAGTLMVSKGAAGRIVPLHGPKVCLNAVKRIQNEEVLLTGVTCMLHCAGNAEAAKNYCLDGILEELVKMLDLPDASAQVKSIMIQILTKVASIDESFRKAVLKTKAVQTLLGKLNKKSKLIIVIIDFLCVMCANKGDTEGIVNKAKSAISTLIYVIKHSISTKHQHKAFEVLWLIAGSETYERRGLATLIGPSGLIKMLDITSEKHLLMTTTALGLLSPPHHGKQEEIIENGAVALLLPIVQTTAPETQLQALCIMENCSHDIGFRSLETMQDAFTHENGIQGLLRLQANTDDVGVRMQALCTLASASIGNLKIKRAIVKDPLFSLKGLIRLLSEFSPEGETRHFLLLVMRSICYLAYNSLDLQNMILNTKPLPMQPFKALMSMGNSKTSTETAFHAIVLARVFVRNEPEVEIVSYSIRHLTKMLRVALEGGDDELQMHICTFLSGLLHMRAGICHAFIAMDIISLLVQVIFTPFEHCRVTAAIALSYFTKDKLGSRKVLAQCRKNERLFNKIVAYSDRYSLDENFVERWGQYRLAYITPRTESIEKKKYAMMRRRKSSNVISLAFKGTKLFSE